MWSWGSSSSWGELGQNNTLNRSSPVQIGTLSNWSDVSGGNNHVLGLKTDGTLWAWGFNGNGELGQSDLTSRSSPVQIGTLTTWNKISAGSNHSLAIKTDGTLWSWGRGGSGEGGRNNLTGVSSPVQVGTLTNWSNVSAGGYYSIALKSDGTLWAWGINAFGQLGTNNTTTYSSPVQVGTLNTWSKIDSGRDTGSLQFAYSLAIKTDGTLWAWGLNTSGQLGYTQEFTTSLSSPVQLGIWTSWDKIAVNEFASNQFSHAIKTDGTLWAWGSNSSGQLGINVATSPVSPVQVGSYNYWEDVSAGTSSFTAKAKY